MNNTEQFISDIDKGVHALLNPLLNYCGIEDKSIAIVAEHRSNRHILVCSGKNYRAIKIE